jgi:hypothetical protein
VRSSLSLCGKANIDGNISWSENLTQGLQIRQPDDDGGLQAAECGLESETFSSLKLKFSAFPGH